MSPWPKSLRDFISARLLFFFMQPLFCLEHNHDHLGIVNKRGSADLSSQQHQHNIQIIAYLKNSADSQDSMNDNDDSAWKSTKTSTAINYLFIQPYNRSYYFINYTRSQYMQTCFFSIPEDDRRFDTIRKNDGSKVEKLIYECDAATEFCCNDLDCCKTEKLPKWTVFVMIISIIIVICGSKLAIDWWAEREEDHKYKIVPIQKV